jgi:hypothetical protein
MIHVGDSQSSLMREAPSHRMEPKTALMRDSQRTDYK